MGDILTTSVIGTSSSLLVSPSHRDHSAESMKKDRLARVFEVSAKPVTVPMSSPRRVETAVKQEDEGIERVEAVIETHLDSDEDHEAETLDSEDQEEKEELNESSSDNKPAMEAGDFSEEEEEEEALEEKTEDKTSSKTSKALQKAKDILLKNP